MGALRHVPIDSGAVVGGYVLGPRLGAGGMGVVYEAVPASGDPVAIKLPYIETLADDHASRKFCDEAIAGSIVEHPNLARVQDRGITPAGIPYLVMRRVVGERLPVRVAREGLLSLRRAATIVRQILDAVDALHAAGIVHGDIKSDNVLVHDERGHEIATVIDFGLAHPQLERNAARSQPDELVSGTPEYMAPEVIRGEESTPAADIYGAGVILYELITGTTPFGGGASSEIAYRHIREDVIPPSLRRADRDVPPILERIVLRALEKAPEDRFPTAAAFAAALAVALPCLDDDRPVLCDVRFSTTAPTIEWTRRGIARGSKRRR